MAVDVGCVCRVCWWQCGVMRNCSAWFVLDLWSKVHFDGSIVFL